VRRRPGRRRLRTDPPARQCEPPAGPMADLRHHFSPAPLHSGRRRARLGGGDGAAQRRARPGQHDHHRLDGARAARPLRTACPPARGITGGTAYTTVEPAPDNGGSDIVRYETATGARSVAVAARQLIPRGATESLDIDDYDWSSDASKLLIFTNTQRVWRQNTRGDYWVLDRAGRTLKKVGGDAPASSLMYAKFSPTGDRVAYVRQGDLYVERLADGRIARLTT